MIKDVFHSPFLISEESPSCGFRRRPSFPQTQLTPTSVLLRFKMTEMCVAFDEAVLGLKSSPFSLKPPFPVDVYPRKKTFKKINHADCIRFDEPSKYQSRSTPNSAQSTLLQIPLVLSRPSLCTDSNPFIPLVRGPKSLYKLTKRKKMSVCICNNNTNVGIAVTLIKTWHGT